MPILKNPRREAFAQFIALGKNATEAYISAGFSAGKDGDRSRGAAQSASRLLRNAAVIARIEELSTQIQQSRSTKTWLDREFVIEGLKRNFERAMQARPVLDSAGKPTGEYRYDGNVANRSLELLGKEIGLFVDRKLVGKLSIEDWTPEDFDEAMRKLEEKWGITPQQASALADQCEKEAEQTSE